MRNELPALLGPLRAGFGPMYRLQEIVDPGAILRVLEGFVSSLPADTARIGGPKLIEF